MFPKNKKGMMDDLFDFLFTVLMAFFILLFWGGIMAAGAGEREAGILEEIDEANAQQVLLTYLRTPIAMGDGGATMADLIVWAEENRDERQRLYDLTQNLMSEANNPLWEKITVLYPSTGLSGDVIPILLPKSDPGRGGLNLIPYVVASLPSQRQGEIKVTLSGVRKAKE